MFIGFSFDVMVNKAYLIDAFVLVGV